MERNIKLKRLSAVEVHVEQVATNFEVARTADREILGETLYDAEK
jgi:hypothetical protein